jgi:hypothetical protein
VLDIIQLNISKVIINDTFNGVISKELEINEKENEVLFHSQISDKAICSGGGKGNKVITIWEI